VAIVLNKNLSQRQFHGLKIEDCLVRLLQQIDAKISMKEFAGLAVAASYTRRVNC
jgi:hypothetical protein